MLDISENAIKKIKDVSNKSKSNKFFRISVTGGGCQGFSYKFNFENHIQNDDKVFNFSEVKILIDETSLNFLDGSKLDYIEDMMGSYFKMSNPQATSTCGCGTSFSV